MTAPQDNPRNALDERLRAIGLNPEHHRTIDSPKVGEQTFQATVRITLPTGEEVSCTAEPSVGKGRTVYAACQAMLDQLALTHPHYFEDWETVRVDAQRGDALIKLAGYLVDDPKTAFQTSRWLQSTESNPALADLFDRWRASGDPDLMAWGTHLSVPRKGTLVEAIIWRRFGRKVLAADAVGHLESLRTLLAGR